MRRCWCGNRMRKTSTDWKRLRRMSDREIRAGLARDPDAKPTDAAFWKGAWLVVPERMKRRQERG